MSDLGSSPKGSPKSKASLVRLKSEDMTRKSPLVGGGLIKFNAQPHSFKSPRDLTLGSKLSEKKKFIPNLNVQRQIKKEEVPDKKAEASSHRRNKKDFHADKKERNFRDKPTLIQTESVFADGMGANGLMKKRFPGYGGGQSGDAAGESSLQKPKLDLDLKYDKEEEEKRLKDLLRDDFIDDLKEGSNVPVQLPMIDTGNMFKDIDDIDPDEVKPKMKIKKAQRILDSDDDEDPIEKSEAGLSESFSETDLRLAREATTSEVIRRNEGQIMFIQLPDRLPVWSSQSELQPDSSSSLSATATEAAKDNCKLSSLQDGLVGRLQIRKSGACQIVLGDTVMNVDVGTSVGFLQHAVSVRLPVDAQEPGDMTVLGQVRQRLIVSPKWEELLKDSASSTS